MIGRRPASRRFRFQFLRLERLDERITPTVFTPAQIRQAYGFDQVATVGGTTLTGAGQTIAIVDAFNDPYAASDLGTFDFEFGLPAPPSFRQVSETGGSTSSIATAPSSWALEISLDIEWAHAIAPGANILLVESTTNSTADLFAGVAYARSQSDVSVVSMSWLISEFPNETGAPYTTDLSSPPGQNIAFVACSGDTGGEQFFPATSPHVLAVGGTTLTVSGTTYSETAWADGGGGPSTYFSEPTYQQHAYNGSRRGTPDVAYNGNPNSGVWVYDTINEGWEQIGGTSAGSPQWAPWSRSPIRDGRSKDSARWTAHCSLLPAIYSLPSSDFNDITTGSNGYPATVGYDLATGLGTPKAQFIVPALIAYGATAAPSLPRNRPVRWPMPARRRPSPLPPAATPRRWSNGKSAPMVARLSPTSSGPHRRRTPRPPPIPLTMAMNIGPSSRTALAPGNHQRRDADSRFCPDRDHAADKRVAHRRPDGDLHGLRQRALQADHSMASQLQQQPVF